MRDTSTDQAVVMGGSMAGLLAARVLSERFKRVVVIERDALPSVGEHLRGVPHGRHVHALHPRGLEILNELFPGFSKQLAAGGAVLCDILGDTRWQLVGGNRRPDMADTLAALQAQQGRYTLETVSPDGQRQYERIESISYVLPYDPQLVGFRIYSQAVSADAGQASTVPVAMSNGLQTTFAAMPPTPGTGEKVARVYLNGSPTGTTGSVQPYYGLVCQFTH